MTTRSYEPGLGRRPGLEDEDGAVLATYYIHGYSRYETVCIGKTFEDAKALSSEVMKEGGWEEVGPNYYRRSTKTARAGTDDPTYMYASLNYMLLPFRSE